MSYRQIVVLIIRCSYNKTEDDFDTLEEFNDYLESVEDLSTLTNARICVSYKSIHGGTKS